MVISNYVGGIYVHYTPYVAEPTAMCPPINSESLLRQIVSSSSRMEKLKSRTWKKIR